MDASTTAVIPFGVDDELGLCPTCRRSDGVLHVGREHYGHCDRHRTCWHIGSNLFTAWREQTETQRQANAMHLARYRRVQPFYFARPAASAGHDDLPF